MLENNFQVITGFSADESKRALETAVCMWTPAHPHACCYVDTGTWRALAVVDSVLVAIQVAAKDWVQEAHKWQGPSI